MHPSIGVVAGAGLAAVVLAMTVLWLRSVQLRDASIVDPFWGPGFILVTVSYLAVDGRISPRGLLALGLVTVWAVRLGYHLWRRHRREGEDPRYRAMRETHGHRFWWVSLFTVFWLQALILWIVSAPLLASVRSDSPLGPLDLAGALVFLVGLAIEAAADRQLSRFRLNPANAGRVLDSGLWRYSRHPNYFGESVLWWGLYVVALADGAYWTAIGPALITFLLLRVSGVTLLEKGLHRSRPEYADYVARTSAFVPWPPKRG